MVKIEMNDYDGIVQDLVETVHICVGRDECESPAICEDCGCNASAEAPVYVWTSKAMDYFACGTCLAYDPFARLIEPKS